ncbi:MAG: T9SS type A sorting domain-containing protein [Bacteroidetes bacterium]|nr:T9SS type A sorting domain-containing protein [Bacteroidota bacterium]
MKTIVFILCSVFSLHFVEGWSGVSCFAARLVLNNNAYCVITNGGYIVIDTSSTSGITTLGSGGNIISEADTNRVKWNIGTATGAYIVPFSYTDGTKIPFTFNVTAAGTVSVTPGNLTASTYYTDVTANPNNRPLPIGVTNFNNGAAENDIHGADRFWRINVNNYTANPIADIIFTYREAEWDASAGSRNTITEANLQAQRWNGSMWEAPVGTDDAAANTVTVTGISTFSPWVLVDKTSPLPVEMLYFNATPENNSLVRCEWITATEINNDYFAVERSQYGINFEQIGTVKGAGNSSSTRNYVFYDHEPYSRLSYYRLRQVDYNGAFIYSQIREVYIGVFEIITIYPNPSTDGTIQYIVANEAGGEVSIRVYDVLGRTVISNTETLEGGVATKKLSTALLSSGSYLLQITNGNLEKTQKQFVIK